MGNEGYIVIVDDEPAITRLLAFLIERSLGVKAKSYNNSAAALRELTGDASSVRLLICDLRMPDVDGLQLCRHLRKAECRWPILVLTAYASEAVEAEARAAGADAVIQKPFDPGPFLDRIRALLQASSERVPPASP